VHGVRALAADLPGGDPAPTPALRAPPACLPQAPLRSRLGARPRRIWKERRTFPQKEGRCAVIGHTYLRL